MYYLGLGVTKARVCHVHLIEDLLYIGPPLRIRTRVSRFKSGWPPHNHCTLNTAPTAQHCIPVHITHSGTQHYSALHPQHNTAHLVHSTSCTTQLTVRSKCRRRAPSVLRCLLSSTINKLLIMRVVVRSKSRCDTPVRFYGRCDNTRLIIIIRLLMNSRTGTGARLQRRFRNFIRKQTNENGS